MTWVNLQDKATQESFYVLNTHLLVGAYNKGDNGKKKKRTALYWRQVATVTALADRFQAGGSAVYVTCDCNVNYDADAAPIQMMSDHGLIANWRDLDGSPNSASGSATTTSGRTGPRRSRPSARSPARTTLRWSSRTRRRRARPAP